MKSVVGLALIVCIALDGYVATVLFEEWHARCEFSIQYVVCAFLLFGLPTTFLIEATRNSTSFRTAFVSEIFISSASLGLLLLGTKSMLAAQPSWTCAYTAPRLWRVLIVSVSFSWTCILVGTTVMLLATTFVLIWPGTKTLPNPRINSSPPRTAHMKQHKFKTYYGTL